MLYVYIYIYTRRTRVSIEWGVLRHGSTILTSPGGEGWRVPFSFSHPPFAIFIEGGKSSLVCDTYNNNVASRVGRKGERVRNISTKFSTISPT